VRDRKSTRDMSSRFVNGLAAFGRGAGIARTVLITLSAAILFIVGIVFLVRKDNTRGVDAVVLQVVSCTYEKNRPQQKVPRYNCTLSVGYMVDGRKYSARVTKTSTRRIEEGEFLTIRVNNTDPSKVEVRASYDATGGLFLGLAGLMCVSALSALAMALWARRSRTVAAFMGADTLLDIVI
jgi:uncharacterized protein YxeA